jgi:hypothetical protein
VSGGQKAGNIRAYHSVRKHCGLILGGSVTNSTKVGQNPGKVENDLTQIKACGVCELSRSERESGQGS